MHEFINIDIRCCSQRDIQGKSLLREFFAGGTPQYAVGKVGLHAQEGSDGESRFGRKCSRQMADDRSGVAERTERGNALLAPLAANIEPVLIKCSRHLASFPG